MKHTPGPWHIADDAKLDPAIWHHLPAIQGNNGAMIAGVAMSGAKGEANARLIAKAPIAPKLAEALRKAYRELNEIRARDGVPRTFDGIKAGVDEEYFGEVVDECRAALAEWDAQ